MKNLLPSIQRVPLFFVALILSCASVIVWTANVEAQMPSSTTLSGWIWAGTQQGDDGGSQGVGWISVNSLTDASPINYAVEVNTDLTVTGMAWSENVGWIQFGSGTGRSAQIVSDGDNWQLTGWARALAPVGDAQAGGWDGWISLDGADYGITFNQNGNTVGTPYAWGDDVMGWLDFTNIQVNALSCSNTNTCDGDELVTNDLFCSEVSRTTCEFGCDSGACIAGIAGSLDARPPVVRSGRTVRLVWDAPTASSCELNSTESGHGTQSGLSNVGEVESQPITNNEVTFTLSCDGVEVDTTTVRRLPNIYES